MRVVRIQSAIIKMITLGLPKHILLIISNRFSWAKSLKLGLGSVRLSAQRHYANMNLSI